MTNEGDIRVWWIPRIGRENEEFFYDGVANLREAFAILDAIAEYDIFQHENGIREDFSNAGGVEIFTNGEWEEYEKED